VLCVSALMIAGSLTMLGFMFHWFGGDGCHLQRFLVSFTLILSVLVTALSISEKVVHGALLPSALMVLYAHWLCFSALSSDPSSCNTLAAGDDRSALNMAVSLLIAAASITYTAWSTSTSDFMGGTGAGGGGAGGADELLPNRSHSDAESEAEQGEGGRAVNDTGAGGGGEGGGEDASLDEATAASVNKFHWTMLVAAMYTACVLTDWGSSASAQSRTFDRSAEAMWIKVVTQWLGFTLYGWSLVAPLVFPDRDFGYGDTN
jgi:hypothetical protein